MFKAWLAATVLAAVADAQALAARPVGIDGHHIAPLTEESFSFTCGTLRVSISYREERLWLKDVSDLRDALRVTSGDLTVNGRSISSSDRASIQAAFDELAWVRDVQGWCEDGRVDIRLQAMRVGEWVDFIEERTSERPDLHSMTLQVSSAGSVTFN